MCVLKTLLSLVWRFVFFSPLLLARQVHLCSDAFQWLLTKTHFSTCIVNIFINLSPPPPPFPFYLPSTSSSWSSSGWAHRKWMYGGVDVEDYRLWPGKRMAQDHKDEHRWHLCLDGARSHQVLHVLQRQWCLEVSLWMCVLINSLLLKDCCGLGKEMM